MHRVEAYFQRSACHSREPQRVRFAVSPHVKYGGSNAFRNRIGPVRDAEGNERALVSFSQCRRFRFSKR